MKVDKTDQKKRIEKIIKDTELLKESMEIVNELVAEQQEKINFIEDDIKESLSQVKYGEQNIVISNQYNSSLSYIYYIGGLIGAGIIYLTIL